MQFTAHSCSRIAVSAGALPLPPHVVVANVGRLQQYSSFSRSQQASHIGRLQALNSNSASHASARHPRDCSAHAQVSSVTSLPPASDWNEVSSITPLLPPSAEDSDEDTLLEIISVPSTSDEIAQELGRAVNTLEDDESIEKHMVSWYPGHIARAERQLKEKLQMVDVVLEVRDARIPVSTCHPQLAEWLGSKPRLLVMNRTDMVSKADRIAWNKYFMDVAAEEQQRLTQWKQQLHAPPSNTSGGSNGGGSSAGPKSSSSSSSKDTSPSSPASSNKSYKAPQPGSQQSLGPGGSQPPPLLPVVWTDGKLGDGIKVLKSALTRAAAALNARRARRGLQPRAVRAVVIGFPNIGKSALINRLLNRKAVESADKVGVTRGLNWARLLGQLDLLDAPGVIPASFRDQVAASRLAICNDIGEASYIDSLVAAAFVARVRRLPDSVALLGRFSKRYGVDATAGTSEDVVIAVSKILFHGDVEKGGARMLKDYRNGLLGAFALELPSDLDRKRARDATLAAAAAANDARDTLLDRSTNELQGQFDRLPPAVMAGGAGGKVVAPTAANKSQAGGW
ncbi:MAG: hypothetical protein WDW36_008465 [Sanguina aurantia]